MLPHVADLSKSLSTRLACEWLEPQMLSKVVFKVASFLEQHVALGILAHVDLKFLVGRLVLHREHFVRLGGECRESLQ